MVRARLTRLDTFRSLSSITQPQCNQARRQWHDLWTTHQLGPIITYLGLQKTWQLHEPTPCVWINICINIWIIIGSEVSSLYFLFLATHHPQWKEQMIHPWQGKVPYESHGDQSPRNLISNFQNPIVCVFIRNYRISSYYFCYELNT